MRKYLTVLLLLGTVGLFGCQTTIEDTTEQLTTKDTTEASTEETTEEVPKTPYDYEIWYADYEPVPQSPYRIAMWQYTEEGQVPGVEGNVDINVWFPAD